MQRNDNASSVYRRKCLECPHMYYIGVEIASRNCNLAGSGPCARPRDFQNRLLNIVLTNFGRSLPPLMVEQTPTALLVDRQRGSFHTLPNRSSNCPCGLLRQWLPALEAFTPPPETHDRSNVEPGERRDLYTLTFSTICNIAKHSALKGLFTHYL